MIEEVICEAYREHLIGPELYEKDGMNWEEIEYLVQLAKTETPSPELLARQIHSSSHADPYYMFLRRLAMRAKETGVFLEIGCYYGCVAAHFDSVGSLLTYVGIDINPVPFSSSRTMMIQGDSIGVCSNGLPTVEVVRKIAEACGGIQYVFQDSSHHYGASVKEWELYSPLVKPGGLWVSDDLTPAFKTKFEEKGMVEYFSELPGDKRIYPDLHIGSLIGIIRL